MEDARGDAASRQGGRCAPYFAIVLVPGWERASERALAVIGLGPGDERWLTPEAAAALAAAEALYGYGPYLARVPVRQRPGRAMPPTIARKRARAHGCARTPRGAPRSRWSPAAIPACSPWPRRCARRSRQGRTAWRALDLAIVPGVTAMLAVAARVGAPLGHDFCAMSLSDNLKPWELIERRLDAAARAGFVIALYNPVSRARPWQLGTALRAAAPASARRDAGGVRPRRRARRRAHGHDARRGRSGERRHGDAASSSARARRASIARPGRAPLVYTPRAAAEASA